MRRGWWQLFACGLLLVSGWGAVLVLGARRPAPRDLRVTVVEQRGRLRAVVRASRPVAFTVDGRVRAAAGPLSCAELGPGTHTALWSVRYLGKPPRRAAHSFLCGPYLEQPWLPGAARLTISQSFLDDGDSARAGDLAGVIAELARRELARVPALRAAAGRVTGVAVRIRIDHHELEVALRARFRDRRGSPSSLTVGVRLRPVVDDRALRLEQRGDAVARLGGAALEVARRRGRAEVTPWAVAGGAIVGGSTFGPIGAAVGGLAGLLFGHDFGGKLGERVARRLVGEQSQAFVKRFLPRVDAALDALLARRIELASVHPALGVRLRPQEVTLVRGEALHLLFSARIAIARNGSIARSGRGAPRAGAPLQPLTEAPATAVRVALSANLFNAAAHALWRHGLLEAVLARQIDRALTPAARELLAFELARIELALPPALARWGAAGATVRLGNVRAVLRPRPRARPLPRTVTLHGSAAVVPSYDSARATVLVATRPAPLQVSCGAGTPRDPLRPCLSQLAGLANGLIAEARPLDVRLPLSWLARPVALDRRHRLAAQVALRSLELRRTPPALVIDVAATLTTAR